MEPAETPSYPGGSLSSKAREPIRRVMKLSFKVLICASLIWVCLVGARASGDQTFEASFFFLAGLLPPTLLIGFLWIFFPQSLGLDVFQRLKRLEQAVFGDESAGTGTMNTFSELRGVEEEPTEVKAYSEAISFSATHVFQIMSESPELREEIAKNTDIRIEGKPRDWRILLNNTMDQDILFRTTAQGEVSPIDFGLSPDFTVELERLMLIYNGGVVLELELLRCMRAGSFEGYRLKGTQRYESGDWEKIVNDLEGVIISLTRADELSA